MRYVFRTKDADMWRQVSEQRDRSLLISSYIYEGKKGKMDKVEGDRWREAGAYKTL